MADDTAVMRGAQSQPAESTRQPEFLTLYLFCLLVILEHTFFAYRSIVGHPPIRVSVFSWIATPIVIMFGYLIMLRVLPRVLFIAILVLDFLASIALIEFRDYFRENFDVHILFHNSGEAGAVSGTFFALIPWYSLGILLFALVAKIILTSQFSTAVLSTTLRRIAFVAVPLWILALFRASPLHASNVLYYDNTVRIHGLYPTVLYDVMFSPPEPTPAEIAKRFAKIQVDEPYHSVPVTLDASEKFDNIVAIQWESLDYNVIGRELEGKRIVPFASALKDQSLFFKLRAFHTAASGTSATDFMFLTGNKPFREYPTYRIEGIDFTDALPNFLKPFGFSPYVVHGLDLTFWGRLGPYRKMGFPDQNMITIDSFESIDTRWAVSDEKVVSKLCESIPTFRSPHLVFWITITSHVPFDYVPNPAFTLRDGMIGDYFNALNYADKHIERLIKQCTTGRTLVLIWGDHSAELKGKTYESRERGEEFIPGYIFFAENGTVTKPKFSSGSEEDFLSGNYDFRSLSHFVRAVAPHHLRKSNNE